MRKGCEGEEKKKWKRIVKIAVHYRCASQPPERRPTGAPTARSNTIMEVKLQVLGKITESLEAIMELILN